MIRTPTSRSQFTNDAELVQACIGGDDQAWRTLVERYQRLVFSVALRTGLSSQDAEDVFQIVFTTLFRRLESLRDQSRLASWLITSTYRESWRISKQQRGQAELDDSIIDPAAPHADLVEQADREQRVRDALSRMDERCKELLTALFMDADTASYEEIADRLGMRIGSIGPTRARCFKKLESFLVEVGL